MDAAEFLNERRDFLYVYPARSASGQGWDVVVRLDGTYSDEAMVKDAAKEIRRVIDSLTDVRHDDRPWWGGPPSK